MRKKTMDLSKFDHELTATSLEIIVSKGNHPQMALIQLSEISYFSQMDDLVVAL